MGTAILVAYPVLRYLVILHGLLNALLHCFDVDSEVPYQHIYLFQDNRACVLSLYYESLKK